MRQPKNEGRTAGEKEGKEEGGRKDRRKESGIMRHTPNKKCT